MASLNEFHKTHQSDIPITHMNVVNQADLIIVSYSLCEQNQSQSVTITIRFLSIRAGRHSGKQYQQGVTQ